MTAPKHIKTIPTKVVGVTFLNPDGSDRQRIIARCRPGADLALVHEPDNPHDDCAVAVRRKTRRGQPGDQLGHLNARLTGEMVNHVAAGRLFSCTLRFVTGGRAGESYGANIDINIYEAE